MGGPNRGTRLNLFEIRQKARASSSHRGSRKLLNGKGKAISLPETADVLCLSAREIAFYKYRITGDMGLKTNADLLPLVIAERLMQNQQQTLACPVLALSLSRAACNLLASHLFQKFRPGDLERIGRAHAREEVDETCNQTSPPGLVTGTKTRSIVTMEVFVEENVIFPVWIFLKLFCSTIDWTLPARIPQEDAGKSSAKLFCHLE